MASPYEYEALRDIFIGGVAAFRKGDPVPAGHLKAHGLKEGEDVKARSEEPEKAPLSEPSKSASKAEWVDYAVSQGMPRGEAERLTRDELVAGYAS